jgi:hypothetical protein
MEPVIPAGAVEPPPSPRSPLQRTAILVPAVALALGGLAILVAQHGAHNRPALAVVVVLVGAVAAVLPFRYGLPLAIGLAGFEGFFHDFVGPRALYWNEAFTAGLVIRSCVVRRPSRREVAAAAALAAVYALYLATGTSLKADLWGGKVLLSSVVVGWALARLGIGRPEWRAIYLALATVAGAGLTLGIWQRAKGVQGLFGLGLDYGQRIREVAGGGHVRIFGGFTSAAPFSYMLAIALCAWIGLFLTGGQERRLARETAWLPVVVIAGIVLAVDRTAVIGLAVAGVVLALAFRRNVLLATAAAAAVIAAVVLLVVGASGGQLGDTAHARASLWREYVADFRVFGAGPASVGSAYDKVGPKDWQPPLVVPNDWDVRFDRIVLDRQSQPLVSSRLKPRPPVTISARARSVDRPRRLVATLGSSLDPPGPAVLSMLVPKAHAVRVAMRVPGGAGGSEPLWLTAVPALLGRTYGGRLVNLVENPSFEQGTTAWYPLEFFAKGATIARDDRVSHRESASLAITPTAAKQGAYTFLTMPPGVYTATAWVRADARTTVVARLTDNVVSALTTNTVVEPDTWTKVSVSGRIERNRNVLYLWTTTKVPFRIDEVQVEPGRTATAYCDGRVPHCRWSGEPDASTSFRAAMTRLTAPLSRTDTTARVASTASPMPRSAPFGLEVDGEQMDVRRILGSRAYLVARSPAARDHEAGAGAWAVLAVPEREELTGDAAVTLTGLRVNPAAPSRTPAERIWERWFDDTPAALEGDGPGLVDNLYVSWIFQYGLLGVVFAAAWIAALLWPWFARRRGPATIAASLVGVFLVVAAVAVSVWEESPTDLLAAVVFAAAFSEQSRAAATRARAGGPPR